MHAVDLRSDTVTRPTPAMRRAMAEAEVGDDVYREDPTVRALEERVAGLLGKDLALFVPSGTMSNQLALLLHTRPGDEVVVGDGAHCMLYESGAAAAWAGVQLAIAGTGGLFDVADLERAVRPPEPWFPRTSLVTLENTHNKAGGRVFPEASARAVAERARALGLGTHLDGARLWNAAVALGAPEARLAEPFDTVSVCFSKGLGAPVGSALVGRRDLVERAWRLRKMLGGGMRQAGVLAAAALHAVEHHRARLEEDHETARQLAARLRDAGLPVGAVDTNIVVFTVEAPTTAARVVELARREGVLIGAMDARTLRAVTHLDAERGAVLEAAGAIARAVAAAREERPAP
ncbi:MAG: aminotransferase class I/II-fold pyridoxal phosphate-dependent enzyme [Polyangiaceae bacterium]|nr:aminotransferase class I/II-fold pyridoxal phosphate-dependent enzyme [Polyangiaceae bacterium]